MPAAKATKEQLDYDVNELKLTPTQIATKYGYLDRASVWKALKYRGIKYPHYALGTRKLTSLQHQFILGTLLGDGCIAPSGFLRISQCYEQESYTDWKASILSEWIRPRGVYYEAKKTKDGSRFISVRFETYTHPEFRAYRKLFYPNGIKYINQDILNQLDNFSVAVWFMDDGSFMKEKGNIRLHTAGFSVEENERMRNWFETKYGIICHVGKISGGYPVLTFYSGHADDFIDIVRPHLIPSMLYKIGC